ncbi:MAG TPA: immunoglobulin domain-containing protein, partial [Opitutaceae bacterium]|nr:immunoglobulin domain-containing protein [Opitutaceae bacterium]
MNFSFLLLRRFYRFQLPAGVLIALLQRAPALQFAATAEEMILSPTTGIVLKSAAAIAAALGAVNSLAGATPLVVSSGSATGFSVPAGTPASVFFSVNGTQTPPVSWSISGTVPPGLDFSGLTSSGTVNVFSLHLEGTPTTPNTYNLSIEVFSAANGSGFSLGPYPYTITVTGSSNAPPVFTTQPTGQTVTAGSAVTFTAAASGTPAPTFQWRKDSSNIAGATSASFSIASVAAGDAGTYSVVASNSAGSATSNNANLTVNPAASAPVFTTQPTGQTVTVGSAVTFNAAASGTPAPTFQWRKDSSNVAGATNASFS